MLEIVDNSYLTEEDIQAMESFLRDFDVYDQTNSVNDHYIRIGSGDTASVYKINDKIVAKSYRLVKDNYVFNGSLQHQAFRESQQIACSTEIENLLLLQEYKSVVTLYAYDKEKSVIFMEFIEGDTLTHMLYADIEDGENRMWKDLFKDLIDVFLQKQIEIWDLHGDNIIVTPENTLRIIDLQYVVGFTTYIRKPVFFDEIDEMCDKDNDSLLHLFYSMTDHVTKGTEDARNRARLKALEYVDLFNKMKTED